MVQRLRSLRNWTKRAARAAIRRGLGPGSVMRRHLPESAKVRLRTARKRLPERLVRLIDKQVTLVAPPSPALLAAGSERPDLPDEPTRVWIAPANFAGQGRAWAQALTDLVDGVGARNMAVRGLIAFDADQEVAPEVYRYPPWQQEQETYLIEGYTHLLLEAERPALGTRYGSTCEVEIQRFQTAGLTVGLIAHGSDLRIPSVHARHFAHSPFDDPQDRTTAILQSRAVQNAKIVREFAGPVFVSTPDLIDYAPEATWCPAVVDLDRWRSDFPVLRRPVPRVVHVPSNGRLKGSDFIDPVLQELAEQGLIDYRSLRHLSQDELRLEYLRADIVVDQVVMGLYGVAAIEAMAAGRVVVGFVGDTVRERILTATGLAVPIIEAVPETLRDVIEGILGDRRTARDIAAQGLAYVRAVHDGRMAADALTELTGGTVTAPEPAEPALAAPVARPLPDLAAPVRLFVGPANFAGQGHAWARAAQEFVPGTSAVSMRVTGARHTFEADYAADAAALTTAEWGAVQVEYLGEFFTHVLLESLRPVTGRRFGRRGDGEWRPLREAGLRLALMAHGSDVRQPSVHRESSRWSPFHDDSWDELEILEANAASRRRLFAEFDGPVFVSTPDLLDYVPGATWCPVVVDTAAWRTMQPPLTRPGPPVVAHVPSSSRMKGSALIDPVMRDFASAGTVDFRRAEEVPAPAMPQLYADADIVLDQFALGSYGVTACEAMAAGRVVVGHVSQQVRDHVRSSTGFDLPIVEATPDSLARVLSDLLADAEATREIAERGPEFVRIVHDGRLSAQVLSPWLTGSA